MGTQGYNIVEVCNFIKNHSAKTKKEEWLFTQRDWDYADLLMKNYELAEDKTAFRIHTKGKGAICIDEKGIGQGTFLVEYFGEIYEPWRWYDR